MNVGENNDREIVITMSRRELEDIRNRILDRDTGPTFTIQEFLNKTKW